MNTRAKRAGWLVATCIACVTPSALAQAGAEAERLFQQAKALVEAGRYADACPMLEESQRLEPAVGTQFNLADCYEHVGRTATAHAQFLDVARIARAAGKFEREKSARERAEKLAPSLARVRVNLASEPPGLEITIDGAPFAKSSWGAPTAIDPGKHLVRASAPGHAPWEENVTAASATTTDVSIPALVDTRPKPKTIVQVAPPPPSTQRTIALVVGGLGVAGLAVGGVAGALSLSHRADAERECPKDVYAFRCPTDAGASSWNAATTAGDVSTIGFIAGGIAIAGAAVLWFTAPSKARAGVAGSRLVVEGSF